MVNVSIECLKKKEDWWSLYISVVKKIPLSKKCYYFFSQENCILVEYLPRRFSEVLFIASRLPLSPLEVHV